MVSDQEIAKGVETLLRQSDPNAATTLNGVVQQLEAKLGLNLSHKAGFIRDQINLLLRSHPQQPLPYLHPQHHAPPPTVKDHFDFQNHPHFHPQFALHHQQQHLLRPQAEPQPQPQPLPQQVQRSAAVVENEANIQNPAANTSKTPKESSGAGTKRRGGPGGLNKVCGVSPELEVIVGQSSLSRTEIVKQLWAYIRKHNLQDPNNKRKIICNEALQSVFETDCTDMFKMNKLLSKHIIALEPTKPGQSKRLKAQIEPASDSTEPTSPSVIISDALAKFFGTDERVMLQSEALRRVWDHIKVNHLEDPLNSVAVVCDAKLQELFGCESISAMGIPEMLARNHLFKR